MLGENSMTAIVLVSHSKDIANGTKALLNKMAKDVNIIAYGGLDKKLGTSLNEIKNIINNLDEDALCFYDLGSADMNIDLALDEYNGNYHICKVNAPIVEGSFTAAVKLATGDSIEDTIKEVESQSFKKSAFN